VIIRYAADSISDFENLKKDITARAIAFLQKQTTTQSLAAASPVKTTQGLRPHEVASLVFVMENSLNGHASIYAIKNDMEKAGYMARAAQLGLMQLTRLGFVATTLIEDDFQNSSYIAYSLTSMGEDWLLSNQHTLELTPSPFSLDFDEKGP
jgi:hypothetical protein